MTIVETTATSGAVLGIVVVLLLQQLGVFAFTSLLETLVAFLIAVAAGAILFAAVGSAIDRRH